MMDQELVRHFADLTDDALFLRVNGVTRQRGRNEQVHFGAHRAAVGVRECDGGCATESHRLAALADGADDGEAG